MTKSTKLNFLEHFYEHLAEDDWLSGIDLYQAGRVSGLQTYEGLVTAKVSGFDRPPAEVRLKIHPAAQYIQWIECTCRKNRAYGQYCEHIAGLMIHIDRERGDILAGLDVKMPLKPPTTVTRQRQVKEKASATPPTEKGESAAHTILQHLKGGIQSVSLLAHGPVIRIRIEIKPGQLTHYDLNTDAAAKFIGGQPDLTQASAEVTRLKILDLKVELGTRLYELEGEKIVAERCVAVKVTQALDVKKLEATDLTFSAGDYKRFTLTAADDDQENYAFFPLKAVSKLLGEEFFFLPSLGYAPLNRRTVNSSWFELPLQRTFKEDEAARFADSGYADYVGAGPVWLTGNLKSPVVLEAPSLSEIVILGEEDGWFRLDPRYGHGKSSVSMASLMQQVRKKKRQFIRSGDVWLKIPEFITQHDWQLDASGESIKVDALGLMRLKATVGDFDRFVGSKQLLNQMRTRLEFSAEAEVPKIIGANLSLRHYQEVGVKWLWWLYKNELHGLLADEMGLGKTHQAMALMSLVLQENPTARFLVICPTTVLDHWDDKVNDFAPNLRAIKYHGSSRASLVRRMEEDCSAVITSYGVLLRDIKYLSAVKWHAVILDEAHFVKNNQTATYKAACRLNSKIRLCLTGTPMENHLGELKNLFDFLVPGYLGSDEYFRKNFMQPMNSGESPETELALQKLIHPFKLRRTKNQVLPDLPAKVEDLRHCGLSDEQVRMYRDVVAMKGRPLVDQLKDEGAPIPYLHVFATISLLKQICDHPALILDGGDFRKHESGKFELLKELLDEALGSGHKVVIYSQYVGMIKIIQAYLTEAKIGHAVLTGQTRNRGEVIERFQTNPDVKVFVGSLLAGGIGIDLTAASEVIHYDRWWNASKENQATDRVHRIGQVKNVQVLKLVSRGTLEEKIDRMIKTKHALFEKFLDRDEEVFKTLSRQELIELLQ